jgi:hypothetical protein
LTLLAVIADLSALNVLAVGCLALAWLGGFFLWRGIPGAGMTTPNRELAQAVFTGSSGAALAVFATIVAGVGGGFLAKRRRELGLAYLLASGGLAVLCIAIASYAGFWGGSALGGNWSTALFSYFAAASLAAAWFTRRSEPAWLGSALILAAAVHGLWLNEWLGAELASRGWTIGRPVLVATVLHSACVAGFAVLMAWAARRQKAAVRAGYRDAMVAPLSWSALGTSLAATPSALIVQHEEFGLHAAYVAALSLAWVVAALFHRARWAWYAFQCAVTVSVVYFTTSLAMQQSWWTDDLLFYPRHLHWQSVALAIECMGWIGLRRLALEVPDNNQRVPGDDSRAGGADFGDGRLPAGRVERTRNPRAPRDKLRRHDLGGLCYFVRQRVAFAGRDLDVVGSRAVGTTIVGGVVGPGNRVRGSPASRRVGF